MISDADLRAQLPHTLGQADLPALGPLYRGKVRDNYSRGDEIVMITTDRTSAFDHVLGTIPFKGEVLSRLTLFWFDKVKDVAPTHLVAAPDPSVMVVKRAKALPVEIIIRGYITGSLWRDYQSGKAAAYGIDWPAGLRKDQAFDAPILRCDRATFAPEGVEVFPTRLPPLRADRPTLVVGKLKAQSASVAVRIEGRVDGSKTTINLSERLPDAESENFFLAALLTQWRDSK